MTEDQVIFLFIMGGIGFFLNGCFTAFCVDYICKKLDANGLDKQPQPQ